MAPAKEKPKATPPRTAAAPAAPAGPASRWVPKGPPGSDAPVKLSDRNYMLSGIGQAVCAIVFVGSIFGLIVLMDTKNGGYISKLPGAATWVSFHSINPALNAFLLNCSLIGCVFFATQRSSHRRAVALENKTAELKKE